MTKIRLKILLSKMCYSKNGVQDGRRCFRSAISQSFFVVELSVWCLHHGLGGQGILSDQLDYNRVNR